MNPRCLIICTLLAGCAEFPELDGTVSEEARNAPFPKLVNTSEFRGTLDEESTLQAEIGGLQSRVADLNNRADNLRSR
jgi:hypothetical protein